ncbi:ABC transporter substrate-binding protein [Neoehrlichia mikurensis]|nr:ABC transporter substrate-binding protein [Neoehrlichia mikurensis]QXK92290.1 ABC transporter substrate-binding protein [Neoehrlichia mikurensis]UTO55852.1 ABC transporter substrate-binding protein [Neoehrlichia mikurensis]
MLALICSSIHADESVCSNCQQVGNFIEELHYISSKIVKQEKNKTSAYAMLQDIMHKSLNIQNITKFVMGIYWKNSSLEQKEKFMHEYGKYIVRMYVKQLYIHASYNMSVFLVKEHTTNSYLVKARLVNQNNVDDFIIVVFTVSYDDTLYIDDIKINNMISIAMHQRSMINYIIKEKGIDGAIRYFADENAKL